MAINPQIPNQTIGGIPENKFANLNTLGEMGVKKAELILKGFGLPIVKEKLYTIPTIPDADVPDLESGLLGLPVYDTLTFESVSYEEMPGKTVNLNKIVLDAVLLTVNQNKKIITTNVQGRPGSVKEYIAMDDFSINIKGVLTGGVDLETGTKTIRADQFPANAMNLLSAFLQSPIALPVFSNYFQYFKSSNLYGSPITNIVVTDYSFSQREGMRNVQFFEINALSDLDDTQTIVLE